VKGVSLEGRSSRLTSCWWEDAAWRRTAERAVRAVDGVVPPSITTLDSEVSIDMSSVASKTARGDRRRREKTGCVCRVEAAASMRLSAAVR
jgi:hypothetical protein